MRITTTLHLDTRADLNRVADALEADAYRAGEDFTHGSDHRGERLYLHGIRQVQADMTLTASRALGHQRTTAGA